MIFKECTQQQKSVLLLYEYIKDGASASVAFESVKNIDNVESILKTVFEYSDNTKITPKLINECYTTFVDKFLEE